MIEMMEYFALGSVIVGVYLIGKLSVRGQYLMALSQILWFIIGFNAPLYGLMIQSAVLFILSIKAIFHWRLTLK